MENRPNAVDQGGNKVYANEGFDPKSDKTTVFYDGACPLCRREIDLYKRLEGSDGIDWQDLSSMDEHQLPSGLSLHTALKRFHVQSSDGLLLSGGMAFVHLWSRLPRLAFLGKVGRLPVISGLIELFYRVFLYCRPVVSTLIRKVEDHW